MGVYFGTDGIRGPATGPLLQAEFLRRIAAGVTCYFGNKAVGKPLHIVIGRDTRGSGERIMKTLGSELSRLGAHVFDGGVAPTPAIAKAVIDLSCDLGVVITASHNPASDNGIKFFGPGGRKLSEATEAGLEKAIDDLHELAESDAQAHIFPYQAAEHYLPYVRSLIHAGDLEGWKIVVDAANGATAGTTPQVLRELGAEVITLGTQPDGTNINAGVGSEYPEQIGRKVRETGAALGIAHDGDGDRLVLVDETGGVVDGDALMGFLAVFFLKRGSLKGETLVTTVMSNLGLDEAVEKAGGRVIRTAVGDRHVSEAMEKFNLAFGGESSGHLIFREWLPTGDGLIAATQVLRAMRMTGKSLSELAASIPLYPQQLVNLRVREKPPLDTVNGLQEAVAEVERSLCGKGRILLRYSGTEPKIRILVEARDQGGLSPAMDGMQHVVRKFLSVVEG